MATVQKNRLSRFRRHLEKKAKVTAASLTPSRLVGRFGGPRILSNSIPKSGTHLLEVLLDEMPAIRNAGVRTIIERDENRPDDVVNRLGKLKAGAFYNAHLPARQEYLQKLREVDAICLFMIRDPRAVAVSRFFYVRDIDQTHPAHADFRDVKDTTTGLKMAINGVPGRMPALQDVYADFADWLECPDVVTVKFEDLRGAAGGGSDGVQREAVSRIIARLKEDGADVDLERVINKLNGGRSSTFRKGSVNSWASEFDDETRELISEKLGVIASRYGYSLSS